jgi:predicted aspartyl protease
MMTGVVTAEREATLPITVVGPKGRTRELDAVVDTGFNGYLTLPQSLVRELELAYHSESVATLGEPS